MPRPAAAPASTITSWPCARYSRTEAGVAPTRYSSSLISFGTPMRMEASSVANVLRGVAGCRGVHKEGPAGRAELRLWLTRPTLLLDSSEKRAHLSRQAQMMHALGNDRLGDQRAVFWRQMA